MIQHSLKWIVLSASFLIHLAPIKCCLYELITHPNKKLSCNPLGSQLQLHCVVSGPSSPSFTLHWYMGNRDGNEAGVLLDTLSNYSTMAGEMVVRSEKGGEKRRTISSVLRTVPILDSHHDQCFWCQVELEDMEVALYKYKHKFCLDASKRQSISPCEDVVVVANMQLSCITLEDVRVVRHALIKKNKVFTTAVSPISSSILSNVELIISATPSSLPFSNTVNSLDASSTLPLPDTSSVTVIDTTSLTVTTAVPTSTTIPQTTSMKGGLIAAISMCIVLIIAIIILVGIVICLSRNRCNSCKEMKEEESNQIVENRNSSVVHIQEATTVQKQSVQEDDADYDDADYDDADYDDADYDSLVITTADLEDIHSVGNVTAVTSSPQHRRQASAPLEFPPKENPNSPRENIQFNFKSPPPPPPLPSAIYNHLGEFGDNQHHYQKCYDAEKGGSNMPPTVHQHTVSREHIYHTLEYSSQVDCAQVEVAVSPHCSYHENQSTESYAGSRGGSQDIVDASQDYSEVMERSIIEQMSPNSMAQQIRWLFDDPCYAMMMVDGEEEERDLSSRREMWHSTPALGSTCLTGRTVGERRSLRLPHAVVVRRESLVNS